MAKRGRTAKVADQQQGHRAATAIELAEELQIEIPAPPSEVSETTLARWDAYWRSPVAKAATEIDLPVIYRLFTYYDEWETCFQEYRKQRTVIGSTGQTRINPLGDQMNKLEEKISKLEAELGLTPLARQRLGIAIGKARLTAAEVNRMAQEPHDDDPDREIIEAEWEEA